MLNLVPFLLILFVIAVVLRVEFFFTILYFLFAVYYLSRLWLQRAGKQLRAERRFVARAFPGDEVTVELSVENCGWLPAPWIEVRDSLPVELASPPFQRAVFGLGPHSRERLRYLLTCRQRGYYAIGPLTLRAGDLFGIHAPLLRDAPTDAMIVYPRVVSLDRLGLPTHSPLAVLQARAPLFEDPARIRGVRPYQLGDSPRRIHWPATAGAGQLLVKQYEPAIARETLICLDLDLEAYPVRQRYDAPELAVITAASAANHSIVREGLPAGLAAVAWDPLTERQTHFSLAPRRERAQLMAILEILARVRLTREPAPLADLLRLESMHLAWGATVVVITGEAGVPRLFDTLAYLRRTGFAVAVIAVQSAALPSALLGQAKVLGIKLYQVWSEAELEALLRIRLMPRRRTASRRGWSA